MPRTKGPDRPAEDETLDSLSCGDLWVLQKKDAYRFSLDAYLLAAFVDEKPGTSVLEIGSGCGVISIILAGRRDLHMTGIEVQDAMAAMSRRSVRLNGLDGRVKIISQDVKTFTGGPFDAIVSNPPYRPLASGRVNPDSARAVARHEIMLELKDLLIKAAGLLVSGGRLYMIYPAWRLADLLSAMRAVALEPKIMRMVHSGIDSGAELVLVCATKNGGRELKVTPPLFIYQSENVYSTAMNRVFAELEMAKTD